MKRVHWITSEAWNVSCDRPLNPWPQLLQNFPIQLLYAAKRPLLIHPQDANWSSLVRILTETQQLHCWSYKKNALVSCFTPIKKNTFMDNRRNKLFPQDFYLIYLLCKRKV